MPDRDLLVIDTETSGLIPGIHEVIEVAWLNRRTRMNDAFIVPHTLENADPDALRINRYRARHLDDSATWDHDYAALRRFHAQLVGNDVTGSNPRFDADMLAPLFEAHGLEQRPFHYSSPRDVGLWAAGVLRRPITARPKLAELCELLGVTAPDHSAMGDVWAVDGCLDALEAQLAQAAA